ncbi:DNA-protecting protein DprA [Myxococcota bacterium]|nr:DNA-protecting protein DprA [Myxococcota bacterium]
MSNLESDLLILGLSISRGKADLIRRLRFAGSTEREMSALGKIDDEIRRLAERKQRALRAFDIQIIPPWDYPDWMSMALPLPVALFVRGDKDLLLAPAISIVGSRKASAQTEEWATERAAQAVSEGYVVVSGGARGIDAAAHRGALKAKGKTLAYLGVAIDRLYPAQNKALFQRILAKDGAIVSEYAPITQTISAAHAARNRFIAAHAQVVLVAEAASGSGTLGTARYARRFDRPVWISPAGLGENRGGLDELLQDAAAQEWPQEGMAFKAAHEAALPKQKNLFD